MSKKEKNKLPNKKTMNLYQPTSKDDPKTVMMIGIGIIAIMSLCITVFAILPMLTDISEAKLKVAEAEETVTVTSAKVANFNAKKEEYYRYSESYSNNEVKLVDRIVILRILEDVTSQFGSVTSTGVADNRVTINLIASDLNQIKDLRKKIEENDLVTNVEIYSATRSTGDVVSSIVFDVAEQEGE